MKDFWNSREGLGVKDGLVLRGHHLIIPDNATTDLGSCPPTLHGYREVAISIGNHMISSAIWY